MLKFNCRYFLVDNIVQYIIQNVNKAFINIDLTVELRRLGLRSACLQVIRSFIAKLRRENNIKLKLNKVIN